MSYTWYVGGSEQFGATFPTFSAFLSDGNIVKVRVFNANGCYDEKSLTFNEMIQKLVTEELENTKQMD